MLDAAPQRRGRARLYGLMLPKIQIEMLGTIPPCIVWYMCADTYFPALFLGEYTCYVIPLMENNLFRAAGVFGGGVCPSLWLPLALGNMSDRLHIPLFLHVPGMPLCFFLCLCVPGRSQVLPLWSFSSFPFCIRVFICLSLSFFPVHISIDYNNPLSQFHFSACDLSGSEFPICCLLLLRPHICSEEGRRAKRRRGTP